MLFGGLPITERKAHSYAVAYYARPMGYGLDATIYPPDVDLKFKNDTPGYILIQAYVDGEDAYFKFYGTSDGRTVEMDGPYIDKRTEPPTDVIVETDTLAPGERKKIDSAHEGFEATWYRTVKKPTEESLIPVETPKETFFSRYKAWPNKYMVGKEKTEDTPKNAIIVPASPE